MRDFAHSLPMALLKAREAVMAGFRPDLEAHGLTEQQWRVLRVLTEHPGITAGELAERAACCSSPASPASSAVWRSVASSTAGPGPATCASPA